MSTSVASAAPVRGFERRSAGGATENPFEPERLFEWRASRDARKLLTNLLCLCIMLVTVPCN